MQKKVPPTNDSRAAIGKALLSPLALTYGAIVGLRNRLYDDHIFAAAHSNVPIICVGNVTVGGSGKTPFTAHLVTALHALGYQPSVLTRGYGGRKKGPYLVHAGDDPLIVGDEALLHAKNLEHLNVSVVVAKDRSAGAHFIDAHNLGDVIILDDGFQHRKLQRDVNILLLDVSTRESVDRWLYGSVLPKGRLREPLESALRRADCVVFVNRLITKERREPTQLELHRRIPSALPCFQFNLYPSHFTDVLREVSYPLSDFSGKSVDAITAIANPQQFFELLRSIGLSVDTTRAFRDHHRFSTREWTAIDRSSDRPICTTEKDAVKLRPLLAKPERLFSLSLSSQFASESQERKFLDLISKALKTTRQHHESQRR